GAGLEQCEAGPARAQAVEPHHGRRGGAQRQHGDLRRAEHGRRAERFGRQVRRVHRGVVSATSSPRVLPLARKTREATTVRGCLVSVQLQVDRPDVPTRAAARVARATTSAGAASGFGKARAQGSWRGGGVNPCLVGSPCYASAAPVAAIRPPASRNAATMRMLSYDTRPSRASNTGFNRAPSLASSAAAIAAWSAAFTQGSMLAGGSRRTNSTRYWQAVLGAPPHPAAA